MLRIYPVCLEIVREVRVLADRIATFDRDHARQLRRSALSVANNVGEGWGNSGGTRRARYSSALGSARESLINLECAEAAGYVDGIDGALRNRFNHVIGVLVKLTR
jgi:four helix bundle protein